MTTSLYTPKYFTLEELWPPGFDMNWLVFDERILKAADMLREEYGPMICNDWKWGGKNKFRGWRPPYTDVGAAYSQHKFGRALDLVPVNCTAKEVTDIIRLTPDFHKLKYITCVEVGKPWVHIDCRNWDARKQGVKIIS